MRNKVLELALLLVILPGSRHLAAQNLTPPENHEPANTGSGGYSPAFHPTPLTDAEVTAARLAALAQTPSPSKIVLEFPESYTAQVACFGRAFDPRGPFAEPPAAPYLIPGNVSGIAFGPARLLNGGLYLAVTGIGFSDVVSGPKNLDPASGPLRSPENTAGVYELGLDPGTGMCSESRLVSGGPTNRGRFLSGPSPFGNFGATILALGFRGRTLFVNSANQFGTPGPGRGGRLHEVNIRTGARKAIVANLPSEGDHANNQMVFLAGEIVFGQGTATNTGTVDGESVGDIPCYDIELTPAAERFYPFTMGFNRAQRNIVGNPPLQAGERGPHGGLIVRGTIPCNGALLVVNPRVPILPNGDNPSLRVFGIGFRNPFSLGLVPIRVPSIGGTLLVANNSSDVRGQRPLANAGDDLWPLNPLGFPVLNWGWPNEHNYFVAADPQFGLPGNELDGMDTDVFTGNVARRAANQPAQALTGQARLFNFLFASNGKLLRNGVPVEEMVDPDFVAGIGLVSVDSSALGFDFSSAQTFGLVSNLFVATGGNLGFPLGALPQDRVGKDIRRIRINAPFTRFYGAVPTAFAKNASQPGGAANVNTGGFIRPIDVKFSPSQDMLFAADFGAGITIDTGQVGGLRKDNPGGSAGELAATRFEQVAGTSAIWTFRRTGPAPIVGPR